MNTAQTLRNDALAAVGAAAWQKLSDLGLTLLQLDRKRAEYQRCIDAHTGTVVCGFTAIDAGGGGATDDGRADLWDLSGPQPVLLESVPVQSGSFAFSGAPPGAQIAVTILGTDTSTNTGPDFRSGPITAAAAAATPNVEVVLGPVVTLTADDISRWFAAIPPAPPQQLDVSGVGNVVVNIESVAATLAPPAIRLTSITPTSVTFQPVLGAIGNVLSTYQPPAAQVVTP